VDAQVALCVALAAALAIVPFVAAGGVSLAPNTWTEIALTLIGAALGIAAVLTCAPARASGATALFMFAALAALTMLSISWSVQPADSWLEANRTLAYFAAFGGAVALARLAPRRWAAIVGAVALATTAVCFYGLLAKIFPEALDPGEFLGRLRAPFGYWNAVGLMAALGLPACLWVGARRESSGALRALSVPAIGILVIALVLSYSRGALLVAVIGVACWFAIVPLRLRGTLVFVPGAVGGTVGALWAVTTHALARDQIPLDARVTAGHAFGLVLALVLVVLTTAGFAAVFAADRTVLRGERRRRAGVTVLMVLACVPIGGLVALTASSRGLGGEISHTWHTLTDTNAHAANDNAGRLTQLANTRARYWSEGLKVGEHSLLKGAGALGYGTARARYSKDSRVAGHAHSYVIETFADLGLLGVAISLALVLAFAAAAGRAIGARPRLRVPWRGLRAPREPLAPARARERTGLLTLLVVVVTFGLHSAIDWTWFVPGTALPALVCAGWLAGRGPLASPVQRRADTRRETDQAPPTPAARRERRERRTLRRRVTSALAVAGPGPIAAAAAIAAVAIVSTWTIWQPLRSSNADQGALAALGRGETRTAIAAAQIAHVRNPVSVEPLWDLSVIYDASGATEAAHAQLAQAVRLQPANPATWQQLGEYDLQLGRPREALSVLQAALYLDPHSLVTLSAIAQAQRGLQTPAAPRPKHSRSR
jgi:hypothetical protein